MFKLNYWNFHKLSNSNISGKSIIYWTLIGLLASKLSTFSSRDEASIFSLNIYLLITIVGMAMISSYRKSKPQMLDIIPITSSMQVTAYCVMYCKMILYGFGFLLIFFLSMSGLGVLYDLLQSNTSSDYSTLKVSFSGYTFLFELLLTLNIFAVLFFSIFIKNKYYRILETLAGFGVIWCMIILIVNRIPVYHFGEHAIFVQNSKVFHLFGNRLYYGGDIGAWFYTIPNVGMTLLILIVFTGVMVGISYMGACRLNRKRN